MALHPALRRLIAPAMASLPLLAAACAVPEPAAESTGTAGGAGQAAAHGGTFVYGARGGAQHLNWYAEAGGAAGVTFGPIYEGLVSFDYEPGKDYRADPKIVPWLAESWERTGDTVYTFKLRRNAVWHDGEPLTAADVAFTYEYARDPNNNFRLASQLASVDHIEQVDPYTVRLTARGISPNLLRDLAERAMVIYPKHIADRGTRYEDAGIGSGPYKLEKYDRAAGASYVRNERYWMDGAPYMDRVKVTWPLENSALLAAFATGQNDVLQLPDQPQLEAARAIVPGLQFSEYVAENEDALYMRVDRPPFNDLRVRRALHLGFDRQSMLGILMQGRGGLNPPGINGARTGWVIPQDELLKLPGYNSATKSQDAAEARRLLAEAGYGQGLRFKLKYNQTHTRAPQVSQVLAEQLKSIGVEAELQPTERAAFYKDQQTGNFDAYVDTVGSFDPVAKWRALFHSKGGLNGGQINEPEIDRILDQLDVTLDEGEQRRLFIAFQRLLLDKAYEISAPTPIAYAAWQPWVKDYVFNPAGQSYPLNWATLKLDTTRVPSGR